MTDALLEAAARNPVVMLTGPRQSGKTTLARALFANHRYVSLEAPDVRARALDDPRGLLAGGDRLILDEIQRAPDLLSYVQTMVDERDEPGRFVVTGSQNLLLVEAVSQTLAGRAAWLRLHPLSLAELRERPPFDPLRLDRAEPDRPGPPPAHRLWETLVRGFHSRIHDRGLPAAEWLADYVRTYVERDLREVIQVSDPRSFERFLRLAASWTAQELNLTALADDSGVTQQTARRWIAALETGLLATVLPQHHVNFRKRLRKRPRLHFLDTGLICYLLGIPDAGALERHPLRGAVFESFVVSELVKSFAARRRDPPLSFWRDATGHEVDVLIDAGDRVVPVEVKSGATVSPDAVRNLAWWTAIPSNPNRGGVLVHGGDESFDFRGIRVRPWFLE